MSSMRVFCIDLLRRAGAVRRPGRALIFDDERQVLAKRVMSG